MEDEVEKFLSKIGDELDIDMSCIDIEQIDITNAYDSIFEQLQNCDAFRQEVIYYDTAMAFLSEFDNSLKESLTLAAELGYDFGYLNSGVLASLLQTRYTEERFREYEDEINEFFDNLDNKLKEIEELENEN